MPNLKLETLSWLVIPNSADNDCGVPELMTMEREVKRSTTRPRASWQQIPEQFADGNDGAVASHVSFVFGTPFAIMDAMPTLLDPDTLARIRTLELQARQTIDGFLTGGHRSKQHGFAVEFAQHREYVPGDDIRHIDWKVFGRKERFYLKQYELETNLVCWLLVDASESMRYGSSEITKYDLACRAAASLGYLVVQQTDSVGLATFDSKVRQFLRPASQATHLKDVCRLLVGGASNETSKIGPVLHEAAERFARRGVVAIFSDLFDEPAEILSGLKHLKHQRHDVVVFHVLDAAEIEFPFRQSTLFHGLEQLPDLLTDPVGVREGYLNEFNTFRKELQTGCRQHHIDYVELRTDKDLGLSLAEYLVKRESR